MGNVDARLFGTKIKEIRERKHYSLRQVSNQSKTESYPAISPSYWSLVERGQRNIPKVQTLKRMAKGLRIEENEILTLAGLSDSRLPSNAIPYEESKVVPFPVVGSVKCGPDGLAMFDYQGEEFVSKEDIDSSFDYFWLVTTGDSMIGDYIRDGDYALIRRESGFENGDICAIVVDNEKGTLKHITKNENSIVLTASNPNYPPRIFVGEEMNQIYIAGKLIEIKHKF